jgi:predicted transposase/invertase (TIGR01784 family)
MRRDSIFYRLLAQSPTLLLELLPDSPINDEAYRFDSVAVKEPEFEIDGVFLPPEHDGEGVVYFCEVQFQKDETFCERVFSESLLYFYRNRDRSSKRKSSIWNIKIRQDEPIHPSVTCQQGANYYATTVIPHNGS